MPEKKLSSRLALATFAGALVLLVVNDWLLKGRGLVPGWLTGKLSDFAGLIVAPVCLIALLSARRRGAQLACIAAVAGVFALTELSPASAALLVRGLAALGLRWRLWPDVGDLAALAVLPVSWLCCRALFGEAARRGAERLARWLALPACLACLASGGPDAFSARTYVYNATKETTLVEVSSAWLGCDALEAFEPTFLEPEDFESMGLYEVAPGTVLPVEPSGDARAHGDCMCPLLRISTAGRTVNVLVRDVRFVRLEKKPSSDDRKRYRRHLVTLRAEDEPFEIGGYLERFELALPGTSTSQVECLAEEPAPLDASFPPADIINHPTGGSGWKRDLRIAAVTPVAGSCLELTLGETGSSAAPAPAGASAASDAGSDAGREAGSGPGNSTVPAALPRMQICAPLELFPFQVGDAVALDWEESAQPTLIYERLGLRGSKGRFQLRRGRFFNPRYEWPDFEARLPELRCGPLRDAAGAPFEPIDVAYRGQALVPGQAVDIADAADPLYGGPPARLRVYLGRARRDLTRACGVDESWIEVVETWNY